MSRISFKWLVDLLRGLFRTDAAPHCDCIYCQSRAQEMDAFINKLREEGM